MAQVAPRLTPLLAPPSTLDLSGGTPFAPGSLRWTSVPGGGGLGCRSLAPAAVRKSGILTTLDRAIEEDEYRRARAEVHRKGVEVEGHLIEGLSVGGHETCVVVPSMNLAFDIGRCPSRAVHQDFLFITHAHLDHIGGLPMYVATRGLYNLKPPTIFVPPCIKEDVEDLFHIHRKMSQDDLELDLVALDVGETYEIRNDLVVRPFKTHHVIPSQGYVIYSVRKKLRKQYAHLKGTQIKKLKLSGVEITDTILSPEVAFTGDTMSDFILEPRNADALRAKILIMEATFLDDVCDVEQARQHGHIHLLEMNCRLWSMHSGFGTRQYCSLIFHLDTRWRTFEKQYQNYNQSYLQRLLLSLKVSNQHIHDHLPTFDTSLAI